MEDIQKSRIAFFGTPEYSVIVLDELKAAGFKPSLIITNPDKPQGRKMVITPSPVKVWAEKEGIPYKQPSSLKDPVFLNELKQERWDVFIVAAYGKLIPSSVIQLPLHNVLNVHPSLLPKFRGTSPIQSTILADEKETGVSIMVIDEEMDHGPVLAVEHVTAEPWPMSAPELDAILWHKGGQLLAKTIALWIERKIEAVPQDHYKATYTKKITKADGEIDLSADPYKNFLKIKAYEGWPGTYFFEEKDGVRTRMITKKAEFKDGKLTILRVIPEGKKETDY